MLPPTNRGDIASWLHGAVRLIPLPRFDDDRGSLVPFDFEQLPFSPVRLFTVTEAPVGTVRGCHSLIGQQMILVCLAGRVEVEARRKGMGETIVLDRADLGLLIDPGVWSSQRFTTEHSVLLVLASGRYDPTGYRVESPDAVRG